MSENPYAPPKAYVQDYVPPPEHRVRPRQIVLAIQLAAVSYVMSLVVMIPTWDYYAKLQPVMTTILTQVFSVALAGWIYYKIYLGRNWARILLLVFSLIGMLSFLSQVVTDIIAASPLLAKVQMTLGMVINLVILWLLFVSPGRTWFKKAAQTA